MAYANMGGFPSITLPLGFDQKLPFGGNLTGKLFSESKLFSIAKSIENASKIHDLVAKKGN